MQIKGQLPGQTKIIEQIKRDNYPYTTLFTRYLVAVYQLCVRSGLDLIDTCGLIDHTLAPNINIGVVKDKTLGKIDYRDDTPEVAKLYELSPLDNTKTTTMLMRTLIRLSKSHSDAIPELVYLINAIPVERDAEVVQPEVVTPVTHISAPKIVAKPKAEVTTPAANVHHIKPVHELTSEEKAVKATKRLQKVVESIEKPKPKMVVAKEPVKDPEPSKIDTLVKKAEELSKNAKNLAESDVEGKEVSTNPLLNNFFDY